MILVFSGCVTTSNNKSREIENTPSMQTYHIKALQYEKNDDLQLALANWRIAEQILIDRINAITSHIENNGEMHFQLGVTLFNAGDMKLAKIEFLKALRYDSEHSAALVYLQNWYTPSKFMSHKIKPDDTFQKIAMRIYGDENNDYIVECFAGNNGRKTLIAGEIIKLPVLDIELTKHFFSFKKEILIARRLFKKKEFEKMIIVAENILKYVPSNKESVFMINTACYRLGEKYFKEGKYDKAIEYFARVDINFKNVKKKIAKVQLAHDRMKDKTTESENHKYYNNALNLYKAKDYIKALASVNKVSSDYKSVANLKMKIKTGMNKKSDLHYKRGVKLFVNEKLQLAIKEWEKALILSPEKRIIERDIENARNLLEKINKME